MKKALLILLILSFLVPSFAFSDTEHELIGTWVGSSEFYYGEVTYFLVRLYEDHSALYESNLIRMYDSESAGFVYNASWTLDDEGVHVRYNNFWDDKKEDDLLLQLTQSHHLALLLDSSYIIFVKLPELKEAGSFHTVTSWDD